MDLTLYNKYNAELTEELDLSDFNLKDVQLKLPRIKHKWVKRQIDQKIELEKFKKLRTKAIETIIEENRKTNRIALSDAALKVQAEKHEVVGKIDDKLSEIEILIDYLTKVERVCNQSRMARKRYSVGFCVRGN